MPFDGLRVLALESRRAVEIEKLIRARGGDPFVAPSMREVPLEDNPEAFDFAARLFKPDSDFDLVILLTGVGTRLLNQILETRYPSGSLAEALKKVTVVARGPKPMAVMREWSVPALLVREPNTWREILEVLEGRPEKRIAVQEYGRPAAELIEALEHRGATVTSVPVYQWELPADTGPLREAARRLAANQFDVVMFTTSMQIPHLLRIAAEEGVEEAAVAGLKRAVIASIGPTTSETLRDFALAPDFEPSHPKMGFLVSELSDAARKLLQSKRPL